MYQLFINTTDSFEDCWDPFFTLLRKFWPDWSGPIFLNTEKKVYRHLGLEIVSIQNGLSHGSWSQCLERGLHSLSEDHVLYMQEDYFLHHPVNVAKLAEIYGLFQNHRLSCVHLTDQCSSGPFKKQTPSQLLWEFSPKAAYRIGLQAAFWDRRALLKYLRPHEDPWQFEHYGTLRAHYVEDSIYAVNQDLVRRGESEILPYIFTGIVRGRWNPEVSEVFSRNGIELDLSVRGFEDEHRTELFSKRLKKFFGRLLGGLWSGPEILGMWLRRNRWRRRFK